VGWPLDAAVQPASEPQARGGLASWLEKLPLGLGRTKDSPNPEMPSILDVLNISLNIMQVRITRSRLAGEPADIIIRPRLSSLASMDYHQAEIAIAEGGRAAEQVLPELRELLGSGLSQDLPLH
jgi:NTE family protein